MTAAETERRRRAALGLLCPYCGSGDRSSVALPAIRQCHGCDSIEHRQPGGGAAWYPSHAIRRAVSEP